LGVAKTRDGSGYLFFGSDGGCHWDCSGTAPRSGSVTVSTGTLDQPLGSPIGDPNPAPYEFVFPTSDNLPPTIDYAGGGPVYRVPDGQPGAGSLLLVYHIERPANPFWSWAGIAKSTDEGLTWRDLGLIISFPIPYTANGAGDIGDPTLVPYTDPSSQQKYFYLFFSHHCWTTSTAACSNFTYLSVARASYEELLTDAMMDSSVSGLFHKYYQGSWSQPGLGGKASETFPRVTGETDGDFEVAWSASRNRFVAIGDNAQYITYGESTDGLHWPSMQILVGTNPQTPVYAYANAIGIGDDPGLLGDTFYSYYTVFPTGQSWNPTALYRLTISTASCSTNPSVLQTSSAK
jgi:hypothetical protein